jgi:metallo-beta-lactamase family protein
MKIHFAGAAGEVTGSKHLLEINGKFILLDCGLFQGRRKEAFEKNKDFPFNAKKIDAVVVSHAHLDHCGNLPTLYKKGYDGDIFCTEPSSDIIPIMLKDSAYIQEADSQFAQKHLQNPSIPIAPLYTKDDLPPVFESLKGIAYHEKFEIIPNTGIFGEFYRAGHILGSAVVKIIFPEKNEETQRIEEKILVFSGDLGQKEKNLLHDPQIPEKADYLLIESTYGNRVHQTENTPSKRQQLSDIINTAIAERGKIIIPSFSLQRTQEIIYDLHLLLEEKKIPEIPVFIDSPLATRVTEVYKKYRKDFDAETQEEFFRHGNVPLEGKNIKYTQSVEESKKIKNHKGPAIIVSASGMCEGGRIRHHLKNEISKTNSTILFVGYQAEYTLGRKILERRPSVKIFDTYFRVKAHIKKINGYSGHADKNDLELFISGISGLKTIFLIHGEHSQSYEFAKTLRQKSKAEQKNWTVDIPQSGDIIDPEAISFAKSF